ncbi:hypothetical protein HID58_018687, partial [Brassica napus]
NKKKTQTLCRVSFTKRSLRRLRHLHLRWSLFPHNRLCLRHLYRNSNLSPASSTIIHLHLFLTRQTRNRFRHSHIRLQLQRATTSANSTLTSTLTVTTIQVADKEKGVVLETTKTKKQSKLKLYVNKSVLKEFPMMAKTVANQVIKIFHAQFSFLLETPPLMILKFYGHMISLNKVGSDAMSICGY